VPVVLLAGSLVLLVVRLVRIIREFRHDSSAAARGALWTVIPFAVASVAAALVVAFPPLPLEGLGTPQTTLRHFSDCLTVRKRLPIVSGRLQDGHLQFDWIGGPAWIDPIRAESLGRADEHIRLYVYPAPSPQNNVDVVFASIDGVARTAAFGTTDRSRLYDVGDPHAIQLGDSAACVSAMLGRPSIALSRGVEYDTGTKVRRFYGFSDDGRVEWIGYAVGAPVVTSLETTHFMLPIVNAAFAICGLCALTVLFGRPGARLIRRLVRRHFAPSSNHSKEPRGASEAALPLADAPIAETPAASSPLKLHDGSARP
jgi:hypothetical protein